MRVLLIIWAMLLIFLAWFVIAINAYNPNKIDVEYELELTNQTHCKIRNVETGQIYITTFDSIPEILLLDNL